MRILAILAASYTAAAAMAVYGRLGECLLPLCALCALAAAAGGLLIRKRPGRRSRTAALCALGLALGFGWTACYQTVFVAPARALDGQTVRVTAQVLQWPQESGQGGGYSVLVRMDTVQGVGVDAVLYVDGQGARLRPGDRIGSVARLHFAGTGASGEEITYYTAKGVFLWGRAYGTLCVDCPKRPALRVWPALLSRALEDSITASFSRDDAAQVLAVVMGNRNDLTQPFTTSLQRTGLSHTAAVSGMHLAFLAGALTLILGKHRRGTSLIVMPVTLLFMLVAGCTPSVVRAAVMILLLLSAPLFDRERDDATSLGTALLVLLVHNPMAVAHVGLQLSFAAVAGIFLVSDSIQLRLRQALHIRHAGRWSPGWFAGLIANYVSGCLSATLGALIFTVPLTALHFSSVSLLSPISNLLTLWAVAVVFCGGLAVGLTGLVCPALGPVLATAVAPAVRYLDFTVRALSRFTFAAVTMDSYYYKLWVCVLSLWLLMMLVGKKQARARVFVSVMAAGFAAAAVFTCLDFASGPVSVTALDVGQGQCVLVRQGGYMTLVDCGGDGYNDAGDVAADCLQNAGRSRLDLLVLTHFHDDHANGVPQLLERLKVEEIAMPDEDPDSPLRREILALAEEKGVRCTFVREDAVRTLGADSILTLYAPLGGSGVNERGLAVLASTGSFDALLTGDMGIEVEQLLISHAGLPNVELLVAGHHGSKYATSRQLLDAVSPELVLISVGGNNYYGHPAPETLERLNEAGAEVYRTDRSGAVTVQVSGEGTRDDW